MAGPTIDLAPLKTRGSAVLNAGGTAVAVTLDAQRMYTVWHLGIDDQGDPTEALVFLAEGEAPSATLTEATNKLILPPGKAITLPPGWGALHHLAETGTVVLDIIPTELARW